MMKALKIGRMAYECIKGLKNILETKSLRSHAHILHNAFADLQACSRKIWISKVSLCVFGHNEKSKNMTIWKPLETIEFTFKNPKKWKYVA